MSGGHSAWALDHRAAGPMDTASRSASHSAFIGCQACLGKGEDSGGREVTEKNDQEVTKEGEVDKIVL